MLRERRRSRRRSRARIIMRMLRAASMSTTQTRLMVRTGLNYPNFIAYLAELLEKGLIERILTSDDKGLFRITREGRIVLRSLQDAQKHIEL